MHAMSLTGMMVVLLSLFGAAVLPHEMKTRLCLPFAKLAKRHPVGSLAAIVTLLLVARLCCLPVLPKPTPIIPDEHSNLFLAQTLAAGRLANPAHPMGSHFETLFILQRPAYASVYPPVQGAFLATGLVLFHQPWAGVLVSIAAMCTAIVWMLRAYMTRLWALYGGVLAGAGFAVLSYWTNSYWGGAGAAVGGALVFGAFPRILSTGRRRHEAVLGLGLIILANSRPYEGLLAVLPAAFCLALHFSRKTPGRVNALRSQPPVLIFVILAGAILTGCYNWRVTGSPFHLPHSSYMQQYAASPAFVWQRPEVAPEYRDRVLRDAHLSFGIDYSEYSTFTGAARMSFRKLARVAVFYWGPLWPLVLLVLPEFMRERRFRTVLFSVALCLAGILLTVGFQVHYAAPCTSIFILLLTDTFRRLRRQWPWAGGVLAIAAPLAWMGTQALHLREPRPLNSLHFRPTIQASIAAKPGRHVVFVHYSPSHPLGEEWVYNEPDIDRSQIVWARDLGRQINRELVHYYPDRTFWLLEPDYAEPRLSRCTPECTPPQDGLPPSLGH